MKGGTIKVTNSHGEGISVSSSTYRGKTYGGKIKVTGGSITATTRKPKSSSAISASYMTNKISCLKEIKGSLPHGASFKVGGNRYKVARDWSGDVVLAKYGAKATDVVLNTVKFGGYKYTINGVGSKAFNTKAGAEVESIKFKNEFRVAGANAFAGVESLSELRLGWLDTTTKRDDDGNEVSVKWDKYTSINKKAFANCGKDGGAGLTVYARGMSTTSVSTGSNTWRYEITNPDIYRKLFTSKGMSDSFTLAYDESRSY